ncbi:carboxypeptidase-like regulatory domain-containing protein [Cellulophaga baltica]|uniref:carboxypeptidase-like regulatory domain-containing protein n=1 Tax=Cellulophaga TaxID=104264 RepID=UPI001C076756|nr:MULTISPECIES: carboxypeptidase-like regulatory domain-containing protein [Cellulophaga]MBU2995011.1 carboxypeptidase-like regulatory domain-containing protein [Cellulophaga baltica]MDO6766406.1 carboxypeptidase-like regulatory domain-containing protein [Cellulophaga sp. 1_MG-2023]
MKKILLLLLFITNVTIGFSQSQERSLLRGKVLYRDVSVQNENVINVTTERGVITNKNGEYEINVKLGDELVFTSVNYQIRRVIITQDILDNNRLVVEVNEKVTELEEVVVTPENQEAFLKVKNEEFKEHTYEIDRTTEVENIALSQTERGLQNGLNFVSLFKAVKKGLKGNDGEKEVVKQMKLSEVLRTVYDDEFFTKDLQLPKDRINEFLYYCDVHMPERSLLRKDHEFQLIEALVNHSKEFRKGLDDKE